MIADDERGIAGAAADELAGPDLALHDGAAERRRDGSFGADLPALLEGGDLLFLASQDTQPIMGRLERRLRGAHVVLCRSEIVLGVLPFL